MDFYPYPYVSLEVDDPGKIVETTYPFTYVTVLYQVYLPTKKKRKTFNEYDSITKLHTIM